MKYKTITDTSYDLVNNLLEKLLKDRGVENVEALINVSEKDILDPFLMTNMKEGVALLKKHIDKESKIHIIIDSDFDGYSSASLMWLYLKRNFDIEATYNIHPNKEHGIILKELEEFDFDLLIVPDAGSSDFEEHYNLQEQGKDVLVLDHHECEGFSHCATVINPNVNGCNYANKTLAGVGVTYKFCKALDVEYGFHNADDYLDLVACGNIADSVDLRSLETRFLTLKGLKLLVKDKGLAEQGLQTQGNKFIRAIVEKKKDRDLKLINITSIGWKVAPIINGTIRAGKHEEKIDMFNAFIEKEEKRIYQPRRKKKTDPKTDPIEITLQEEMVRVCTNAKAKQDRVTKKAKELLDERIIEKKLNEGKVLIVDGTDCIEDKTLTGLIANKLASEYNKPVLLLKNNGDSFGGSARNFRMSPIEDLKELVNDTGLIKGSGHGNAFGLSVKRENIIEAKNKLEEALKDVSMENTHLVDYAIPVGRLRKQDVLKVGELKEYWGNTLPEPKFAITNITINVADIELIGERKNILKFKKGDLTFIKFFASEKYRDKMILRNRTGFGKAPKTVTMTVIGTFEQNEYEGRYYPQIVIHDFESKKKEEILF